MKTFVMLTKLSPETSKLMKDRAKLGRKWLEQVKEKCPEVKFISHYALLGHYDFLDIYQQFHIKDSWNWQKRFHNQSLILYCNFN